MTKISVYYIFTYIIIISYTYRLRRFQEYDNRTRRHTVIIIVLLCFQTKPVERRPVKELVRFIIE